MPIRAHGRFSPVATGAAFMTESAAGGMLSRAVLRDQRSWLLLAAKAWHTPTGAKIVPPTCVERREEMGTGTSKTRSQSPFLPDALSRPLAWARAAVKRRHGNYSLFCRPP
jgi:hypothetical protein